MPSFICIHCHATQDTNSQCTSCANPDPLVQIYSYESIEQALERTKTEPQKRVQYIEEILSRPKPSTTWLADKIIPKGALTILGGKRSTFKTSIALSLALAMANSAPAFRLFNTQKTKTLLLDGESGEFVLPNYLRRLRASNELVGVIPMHNFNLLDDKDLARLKELVLKEGFGCIIVDSLRRALHGDENDSQVLSGFLTNCKTIPADTGASVIVIHHERKQIQGLNNGESDSFDQMDALRGSSDIAAAADMVLQLSRLKTSDVVELTITKSRFSEEGTPYTITRVKVEAGGEEWDEFVCNPGTIDKSDKMKVEVLKYIYKKGLAQVTSADLIDEFKPMYSERSINSLISRLKDDGLFNPTGKRGKHDVSLDLVKGFLVGVGVVSGVEGQRELGENG